MRIIMLAVTAMGLAACATAAFAPAERTAKAQATYDRMLAGKVAGAPLQCLPRFRTDDMTVIDDNTILFREGSTVYVNKTIGDCSQLGRGGAALVTRSISSTMCRGDIAQVVDNTTGIHLGSCAIGSFTPYRPG